MVASATVDRVAGETDTTRITIGRLSVDQMHELAKRAVAERIVQRQFYPGVEVREVQRDATVTKSDDGPIEAVINSGVIDRYGTIVDPKGGKFDNFLKNPVTLWAHGSDWMQGSLPVGVVTNLHVTADAIVAQVEFDMEQELGATLDRKYRKKQMRGFSIGFIPSSYNIEQIEGNSIIRYTDWELVELSAVGVPANPEALARELQAGEILGGNAPARALMLKACEQALGREIPPYVPGTQQPPAKNPPAAPPADQQAQSRHVDVQVAEGMFVRVLLKDGQTEAQALSELRAKLTPPKPEPRFVNIEVGANGELVIPEELAPSLRQALGVTDQPAKPGKPKPAAAAVVAADDFPVAWERAWKPQDEHNATGGNVDVLKAMCALAVEKQVEGGNAIDTRFPHHHADGTLSWYGLQTAMAELLTTTRDLTGAQMDEAYDHLAVHYRALKIEPPEPGAKSLDEVCQLALEGRMALLDNDENSFVFVEAVEQSGNWLAGFVQVDDFEKLRLMPGPTEGKMRDHKLWGKRTPVIDAAPNASTQLTLDEALAEIERLRGLTNLKRAGKKFSQATKDKLAEHVKMVGEHCKSIRSSIGELKKSADTVSSMLEDAENASGSEDDDDDDQDDDDEEDDDEGQKGLHTGVSGRDTGVGSSLVAPDGNLAGLLVDTGFLRQIASEMSKSH